MVAVACDLHHDKLVVYAALRRNDAIIQPPNHEYKEREILSSTFKFTRKYFVSQLFGMESKVL